MAFGLFRKRVPEPAAPAVEPKVPAAVPATEAVASEGDSAKEILELLELELGGMIRQLERAAIRLPAAPRQPRRRSTPSASAPMP